MGDLVPSRYEEVGKFIFESLIHSFSIYVDYKYDFPFSNLMYLIKRRYSKKKKNNVSSVDQACCCYKLERRPAFFFSCS